MKKSKLFAFILCVSLATMARANSILLPLYHYVYTPLPTIYGYVDVEPVAINNQNQVVGTAYVPGPGLPEAFMSSGGQIKLYPSPGGYSDSFGLGINSAGVIVGIGTVPTGMHAIYANPGSAAIDINNNPQQDSSARALTDNGYFVGQVNNQPAFGSTTGHWISSVASLLGADFYMTGINNDLTAIGFGSAGGAIWEVSTNAVTQLSTVLGTTANKPTAINQNGAVAGTVGTTGFIYENGTVTYFGTNIASVNGINSSNHIVGSLTNGHGYLYSASTHTLTDVNTLVPSSVSSEWTIKSATGINDHNSICGLAVRADGSSGYQGYTLVISSYLSVRLATPEVYVKN